MDGDDAKSFLLTKVDNFGIDILEERPKPWKRRLLWRSISVGRFMVGKVAKPLGW